MTSKSHGGEPVSRRDFLGAATIGGGVLFGAGLIGASPAQAKMPQSAVRYQPKPNGAKQCSNCKVWQAPASCKLVDGKISPTAWCILYQPNK